MIDISFWTRFPCLDTIYNKFISTDVAKIICLKFSSQPRARNKLIQPHHVSKYYLLSNVGINTLSFSQGMEEQV